MVDSCIRRVIEKMKKNNLYIFGVIAIFFLILLAVFKQYELLPGTAVMFFGVLIGSFHSIKENGTTKTMIEDTSFIVLLTAISMEFVSIALFVIYTFIVCYEWLKYVVLVFATISITIHIIWFYNYIKSIRANN